MRFWRFEINWITPEKEDAIVMGSDIPFPVHIQTKQTKPLVKKATTRKKDENQKPKRTKKA